MLNIPKDKKIVLFDGICNLCESSVQLIIKNDSKDVFRFVALQSELGQKIITYLGINSEKTDSIILYEPDVAYYYKSEAAFKIAEELKGKYKLLSFFSVLPTWLSNFVYDYIAKNRYKWYGKKETCLLPTPELLTKFL